ncbi:MAG: ankyrin repeat domain-containing protein [Steroidobacteraceae bacterium]
MRVLEYSGLDAARVAEPYRRVTEALSRGDFRAADAKKLTNLLHGKFYRAKLGHADRLLFSLIRHGEETCVLALEVIEHHAYEKSRFLRGAAVDESKIVDLSASEAHAGTRPVRYLHPDRSAVHFLDKPLSFDDAQEAIYRLAPPLIVVGGAGSGKTALALEKLKHVDGEALYVTHSAYLARSARDLYYAEGFERENQDVLFLSYRDLLESVRVPQGREATWRDFSGWFMRLTQGQAFRGIDAHQAFEEIRGVIAAAPQGILSRGQYLGLGVRQSIFSAEERGRLYELFEKYRGWLAESRLYDLNIIAHEWRRLASPRFDFIVVDEVQDLTTAQLSVALAMLKAPGGFLLCGDSNQIVHPNFFAWNQIKTLFWRDREIAERQQLRVLAANYRNASEVTRIANTLLTVKQRRFGSIDRESNFLVRAVGEERGEAVLLPETPAALRELDARTRQSARLAVLVMRDEDKIEARKHFTTPLLFSVHEAKGLEYDNIVLFRFVSDHRREFSALIEGVSREGLAESGRQEVGQAASGHETLEYRRARDKTDKSLEIYKFFVNSLYVAITRAVRNVYLIESDTEHPLFGLLGLAVAGEARLEASRSSIEEWQKEARKLELQGKEEQAEAIRRTILHRETPPWPVVDEAAARELLVKVFRERVPGDKAKRRLHEYACWHDSPQLAEWLALEAGLGIADSRGALRFDEQRAAIWRKYASAWASSRTKDVLRQCDQYGVEHRTPANQTPLMAAASGGNVTLVEALLDRGADREATDHYGCNALHWALREAFRDAKFARGPLVALYDLLAPSMLDVMVGERLVRIDKHISEYLLFQTMWALFQSRFTHHRARGGFDTAGILEAWQHLPPQVLRPERNRRQYLSGLLSRNEVDREYAWNRALFKRLRQGWYQLNPALSVRVRRGAEEFWRPLIALLNLPLVNEFTPDFNRLWIAYLATLSSLPSPTVPIAGERLFAQEQATRRERERLDAERRPHVERRAGVDLPQQPAEPKWGTPEARQRELERLLRRIEESKHGKTDGPENG